MQENPLQPNTKLARNLELYLMLCHSAILWQRKVTATLTTEILKFKVHNFFC